MLDALSAVAFLHATPHMCTSGVWHNRKHCLPSWIIPALYVRSSELHRLPPLVELIACCGAIRPHAHTEDCSLDSARGFTGSVLSLVTGSASKPRPPCDFHWSVEILSPQQSKAHDRYTLGWYMSLTWHSHFIS